MNQGITKKYIRFAAIFAIVLGIIVSIGWILKIQQVPAILPAYVNMKFNTAFLFVVTGIGLVAIDSEKWQWLRLVAGFLLTTIGFFTFIQPVLNINFGIDQFLIKDYSIQKEGSTLPGRMAQGTSFSFFLIGISFLLMNATSMIVRNISQYLLHIVSLVAFLAIIGYILNVPIFYRLSALGSMAVHTAITLFIVSVGASLWNHQLGITGLFTGKGVGSIMSRQLFPTLTVTVLALSIIRIYLHRKGLISVEFGIALFATSFMLVGLLLIWLSAKQLNKINIKKKYC